MFLIQTKNLLKNDNFKSETIQPQQDSDMKNQRSANTEIVYRQEKTINIKTNQTKTSSTKKASETIKKESILNKDELKKAIIYSVILSPPKSSEIFSKIFGRYKRG